MQVDGSAARFFGVQVYFPELAKRVGLNEMALVVHVKAMVNRVTLHIGDETGNIDNSQVGPFCVHFARRAMS